MKAKQYRVVDCETGNEDITPLDTKAKTDLAFLRLFYARWPTCPRGTVYVVQLSNGRVEFTSWQTCRLLARFIPV